MKIEIKTDQNAESSGVDVSVMGFDMRKTAKLFHMLSSTLYSDKANSVNRELASNCHDSHYLAGNLDKAFIIKAPTYEYPFYEIRDFGVGLTEEEANSTILCYLGSDKDDREDLIGGWGIGSKSPFAYTTSYEVIVYKDGVKTHFTCWKDDNGLPQKAVIDKSETDEPNGVLMRMPVETTDIRTFEVKLRDYLNWTNYNVELHIGENVIKPRVASAEKDFGDFIVKVYPGGTGQRKLVYGGFSYAMDQCVDDRYDYSSYWKKIQAKLRYGYDVSFVLNKPNVVTFAMNREVLEGSEKSRNFVTAMVNTFGELAEQKHELVNKLSEEFFGKANHAKTLVEVDEFIEELNEEIKKQDSSFDTVFVSSSSKVTFEFKTCEKLTHRGVYPLTRATIEPRKTKEQFAIAYGRLAKPGPSARSDFFDDVDEDLTYIYVKAKTEEEALEIIKSKPEFEGYNFEDLMFFEVVIPKKQSTSMQGGYRGPREKPVPYCRERKKRYSWSPGTFYVTCDKLPDLEELKKDIAVEFFLKFSDAHVFLVPTPLFLEETEEADNVFPLEDLTEHAKDYLYKILDNRISTKQEKVLWRIRSKCSDITYRGAPYQEIADELNKIVTDSYMLSRCTDSMMRDASDELKAYITKKLQQNPAVNILRKRASRVIMKYVKIKPYLKYIELDTARDGSDFGNAILKLLEERGIYV